MLVALLARELKQPQAVEEFYRRAVAIFEKLAAEFPRDLSYRWWLAEAHREWAFCLRDNGRTQEAKEIFDLAIANLSKAVELGSKDTDQLHSQRRIRCGRLARFEVGEPLHVGVEPLPNFIHCRFHQSPLGRAAEADQSYQNHAVGFACLASTF